VLQNVRPTTGIGPPSSNKRLAAAQDPRIIWGGADDPSTSPKAHHLTRNCMTKVPAGLANTSWPAPANVQEGPTRVTIYPADDSRKAGLCHWLACGAAIGRPSNSVVLFGGPFSGRDSPSPSAISDLHNPKVIIHRRRRRPGRGGKERCPAGRPNCPMRRLAKTGRASDLGRRGSKPGHPAGQDRT